MTITASSLIAEQLFDAPLTVFTMVVIFLFVFKIGLLNSAMHTILPNLFAVFCKLFKIVFETWVNVYNILFDYRSIVDSCKHFTRLLELKKKELTDIEEAIEQATTEQKNTRGELEGLLKRIEAAREAHSSVIDANNLLDSIIAEKQKDLQILKQQYEQLLKAAHSIPRTNPN